MNMLSEICNAQQSSYPVPSLIEQKKISDRGPLKFTEKQQPSRLQTNMTPG
jgi:hypothetical protein